MPRLFILSFIAFLAVGSPLAAQQTNDEDKAPTTDREVIVDAMRRMKTCFEPDSAVRVDVRLSVAADGSIANVEVGDTIPSSAQACMGGQLESVRFPAQAARRLVFPVVFAAQ